MDFHRLSRKELQALCKKNKIPANKTNVAMADALQALLKVEEMEEGEQEMVMSPQKTEAMETPKPPRAAAPVRTSTRRSTRTGAKEGDVGRKEIGGIPVIEITDTPAAVTGRKAPRGRQTAKMTVGKEKEGEMEENKEVGCGPLDVPVTPGPGVSGRSSSLRSTSKAMTPMVVDTSGLMRSSRRSEVAPVPEVVKMVELPTSEVEEQVMKENGTSEDVEIGGEINEKSDVNGILKVEEEEEDKKEDSVFAEVKICGGDGVPVVDGDENATGAEERTSTTTLEENPASELMILQEEMEEEEQKSMVLALPVEESAKEITGEVVLENLAPPVKESLQEKVNGKVELENPTREEEEAPEESKEGLKLENSAPVEEESPEEIVEELKLDDSSPVERESSELTSGVQLEYSAPVEESLEENPTLVGEEEEEAPDESKKELKSENSAPVEEESLEEMVTGEVELENPTRVGEEEVEAPEESKEELKSENSAPVEEESLEGMVTGEVELDNPTRVGEEEVEAPEESKEELKSENSAPVEEESLEGMVTGEVELENPTLVGEEEEEEAPEESKEELKSENTAPVEEESPEEIVEELELDDSSPVEKESSELISEVHSEYSAPVEEEASPAAISGEVEFPVNDVSALMEVSATVVAVAEIPITTNDVESVVEIPMQVEQPAEAAQKIETGIAVLEEETSVFVKTPAKTRENWQLSSRMKSTVRREMVVMKDGVDKENTGFTTNSRIITFGGEEKSAMKKKKAGRVVKDFQDMSLRKLKNAYKTMVSEKNTTTMVEKRPALAALSESCLNSPPQQKFVS